MKHWTRRNFVKASGASLASLASLNLPNTFAQSSPNERIRHAVIGTGGQGTGHCRAFAKLKDCEVVAVCDLDPARRDKAAASLPNASHVKKYDDFRRLLEDKSIDTVSIATCDHWHTPIALAAILAGKHVYVEKPCSHNVQESRLLVKAARQYKICVQHGTQRRSSGEAMAAVQALRDGVIGKVLVGKAINHQLRKPIGRAPVSQPPAGVNYDFWLGPAPARAFTNNRWHYNWHWFWDYGCGDLGNDGIHQVDVARWGLGVDYPKAVVCSGGQLFYDDDHETPDTQTVICEYEKCHLIYEMRLFTPYALEGHDNGNVFYGTEGKLEIGRKGAVVTLKDGAVKKIDGAGENNMENFLAAVRANDPSRLNARIDLGAISADLCHLGNIGTRLGGQRLEYDYVSGRITRCGGREAEANALLTRPYRAGYELPYGG
ncbi:MAG: Gfo/Idh/MocA family oxidoreductase [Verrucomicrobia bacterium]|nr:Gfo/Idh/MocA family oxidoreductase [Verrucomicrobiota bacterium]